MSVRAPIERSRLLDRGGNPTVRELLSGLVFNPIDGTIRLNGERIVMQRATVGVELRRELINLLGPREARIFLIRLGFVSGVADARFVRTRWPNLDPGDALTAGTRLHTFSGVVRVETVYNDFDFRKKRFAAEFIWHDSVEAEEFKREHKQSAEPVCWTQLGYASGYASESFDTLIVYKEIDCSACGHRDCRVVGKPADMWAPNDAEVILFRERIAASGEDGRMDPRQSVNARTADVGLSALDRIMLAPRREVLDRFAGMALPVLIGGETGTGRERAARYLHRSSIWSNRAIRKVCGSSVSHETCAEIARPLKGGKRSAGETLLIDDVHQVPHDLQERMARAIEEGLIAGGPRVLAIADGSDLSTALHPGLWFALSPLTISMPSLSERLDRLDLAEALLSVLATRMGRQAVRFDQDAARIIKGARWPGNFPQMRSVLAGILAGAERDYVITAADIEFHLNRPLAIGTHSGETKADRRQWLDHMLSEGASALDDLERDLYRAAMDRADGNLSAAARILGITRAQLAYRLRTIGTAAKSQNGNL